MRWRVRLLAGNESNVGLLPHFVYWNTRCGCPRRNRVLGSREGKNDRETREKEVEWFVAVAQAEADDMMLAAQLGLASHGIQTEPRRSARIQGN